MNNTDTNWGQSVAGVVIRNGKILLARHTYGAGKDMLIIPGGYVNYGETPQQALQREFTEETGIAVEAESIIGIRFNMHDWYVIFKAKYLSGTARSDNDENSEVIWLDAENALNRTDVPDLTKQMIKAALSESGGLIYGEYDGNTKYAPQSLYKSSTF